MASIVVNQGTEKAVATDTVGTLNYQVIKIDVGTAGASSPFSGTLAALTNLAGGTVTRVTDGTIATYPTAISSAWSTTVTSGTTTLGTIKPLVSGSAIYITDLIISVGSASNVVIGSGGTSTPIIGTLSLAANGGLVSNFNTPLQTASGSALVYKQDVSGPISVTASGYVK